MSLSLSSSPSPTGTVQSPSLNSTATLTSGSNDCDNGAGRNGSGPQVAVARNAPPAVDIEIAASLSFTGANPSRWRACATPPQTACRRKGMGQVFEFLVLLEQIWTLSQLGHSRFGRWQQGCRKVALYMCSVLGLCLIVLVMCVVDSLSVFLFIPIGPICTLAVEHVVQNGVI